MGTQLNSMNKGSSKGTLAEQLANAPLVRPTDNTAPAAPVVPEVEQEPILPWTITSWKMVGKPTDYLTDDKSESSRKIAVGTVKIDDYTTTFVNLKHVTVTATGKKLYRATLPYITGKGKGQTVFEPIDERGDLAMTNWRLAAAKAFKAYITAQRGDRPRLVKHTATRGLDVSADD